MEFEVVLRGRGCVQVAAYGMADAEHLVDKEIRRLWPEARVHVLEVGRGADARIVDEFSVSFRVEGRLRVVAGASEEAPGMAYRHVRGLLAGSRYLRTEWEAVETRLIPPA